MIIKFKSKIVDTALIITQLNIRELTSLFIGLWFAVQITFAAIEYLIWGETFPHILDAIFSIAMVTLYIWLLHQIYDRLTFKGE